MEDWQYAQAERSEGLAQMHHFTMIKKQGGRDITFAIVVKAP